MKARVALTVIRKIEQGKDNLSLSKVNQVLKMLGHILGPIKEKHRKFIKKNGVLLATPLLNCVLVWVFFIR